MKKRLLTSILTVMMLLLLVGCKSSVNTANNEDKDPYENYKQIETSYGLKYKVPKKWKISDSNTETDAYYYKKEIGSGDGMLYVNYSDFEGDVTDDTIFESLAGGIKKSDHYKDDFKSEYTEINKIPLMRFYYNMDTNNETFKVKAIIFNCKNGYVLISMTSLPNSNYDSYFKKITHSISLDEIENSESSTESPTTTTEPTTEEITTEDTTEAYTPTTGEENALSKAYSYLNTMAFSKSGLIEQLEYEGFTKKEAKYAANNCGANWKEQAVKKAEQYLKNQSFSKSGLIEQLEYEGFTPKQARYGVNKAYK
ncbi:Ltp family lipoprotein [Anaerostipes sp.]|uniref:Ltp family lipoprotein n=1 Tax=Anaerostipes sp. TaxID=1872530 RepID=UPI0025BD34EE|nr:Ltp family lipoprotein [Anaerostipes sp.]MBS7008408.1 Ltp family lipoprotein [Anaerostipes sp.]